MQWNYIFGQKSSTLAIFLFEFGRAVVDSCSRWQKLWHFGKNLWKSRHFSSSRLEIQLDMSTTNLSIDEPQQDTPMTSRNGFSSSVHSSSNSKHWIRRPFLWLAYAIKWLPVGFIAGVICWSYYAFVVALCLFTIESIVEKVFLLIFYHVILALFVVSYFRTIFSPTCVTPSNWKLSTAMVRTRLKLFPNTGLRVKLFVLKGLRVKIFEVNIWHKWHFSCLWSLNPRNLNWTCFFVLRLRDWRRRTRSKTGNICWKFLSSKWSCRLYKDLFRWEKENHSSEVLSLGTGSVDCCWLSNLNQRLTPLRRIVKFTYQNAWSSALS